MHRKQDKESRRSSSSTTPEESKGYESYFSDLRAIVVDDGMN